MKQVLLLIFILLANIQLADAQYRDVKLPQEPTQSPYRDLSMSDTGFWGSVELEGGSSLQQKTSNLQYVNLTLAGGYRFSQYLRAGVGFGGRMYVNNASYRQNTNNVVIPIFITARGNFLDAYIQDGVPFWSASVGTNIDEGLFVSPTLGWSFGGPRNNFLIGLSYTISSFKNYEGFQKTYNYLGVKLGYEF